PPDGLTRSGKPEVHDIAVADDIVPTLEAHAAGVARARLATEMYVIVIGDGLGPNEALLEIGVNDAGRCRRASAFFDGPGARFFRSGGEEGDQAEQRVARTNQPVEPRLVETEMGEKLLAFGRMKLRNFLLDTGRYGNACRAFTPGFFF